MAIKDKICVALDVDNDMDAIALIERLHPFVGVFKLGLQWFTGDISTQPIEVIKNNGCKVFLDLKLNDIPNTVAAAMRNIVAMGVDMTTVHCLGGPDMLKASVEAAHEEADKRGIEPLQIIGVTILTSLDVFQLCKMLGVDWLTKMQPVVTNLRGMAGACKLDGIVCSPLDIEFIRQERGHSLKLITPGIRPSGSDNNDQARVATPEAAFRAGSDLLVIGRPITEALDPEQATRDILLSLKKVDFAME